MYVSVFVASKIVLIKAEGALKYNVIEWVLPYTLDAALLRRMSHLQMLFLRCVVGTLGHQALYHPRLLTIPM
jgi:hypothetical protein